MEELNGSPVQPSLYASRRLWRKFLSYFLLGAGIASTVSGILFFFAYNWNYLPAFTKFGLVEALLIITVLLITFTSWNKIIKQSILTGATFLIGILLAIYGQTYQTGADSYLLFLVWSLFTLLWAIAARFAPLWLLFIGLLSVTVWQYSNQTIFNRSEQTTMLNGITWILAIATCLAEYLYVNNKLAKYNYWFILSTTTATLVYATKLIMTIIFDSSDFSILTIVSGLFLFSSGMIYGWKQKRLFLIATIPFACLVTAIALLTKINETSVASTFLLAIVTIAGTVMIAHLTLILKKQWYGTEK